MLFSKSISGIDEFLKDICDFTKISSEPTRRHSKIQLRWIAQCMSAMIFTGMFCFAHMERSSAHKISARALGWMFRHSKISWGKVFQNSTLRLIKLFGATGFLIIDDTDRLRAKSTKKLFGVQKLKDKKTNGFSMGQNLVVLLFVTKKMTFPVGFKFYIPDPEWTKWKLNDRQLRLRKAPSKSRPKKPARNADFPTKITLACELIEEFKNLSTDLKIVAISADCAFSTTEFTTRCEATFPGVQVISQIRSNQIVRLQHETDMSVSQFFSTQTAVKASVQLRGKVQQNIEYCHAKLRVKSQKRTLHVIALKYAGETEYRYLTASNLTWGAVEVIRAYATRWLVEVFFQDWKMYDGWGKSACQRGCEGARRGVLLSLLVDHFLLSHPLQLERVRTGSAALTAGSLQRMLQSRAILDSVAQLLESPDPKLALQDLYTSLSKWAEYRSSDKHMTGRELGGFGTIEFSA